LHGYSSDWIGLKKSRKDFSRCNVFRETLRISLMNDFPIVSVVEKLGGVSAVARAINVPVGTAHNWITSGNIPYWRQDALMALVREAGIDLAKLRKREPEARAIRDARLAKRKPRVKARKRRAA
jgi:hypothetical protein